MQTTTTTRQPRLHERNAALFLLWSYSYTARNIARAYGVGRAR